MANPKNSSDFNELAKNSGPYIGYDEVKIPSQRGPDAQPESRKFLTGKSLVEAADAALESQISAESRAERFPQWNAEYPTQAAASGQAQHGFDLGSGQACGGQAIGGIVDPYWFSSEDARKLADATLKLQADRNREIAEREAVFRRQDARITLGVGAEIARREMVAKQQAALLDEVAADAVAPMTEREKAGTVAGPLSITPGAIEYRYDQDAYVVSASHWEELKGRFSALEKQVRWLMERGCTHARQIAHLTSRVSDLEHVIAEAFPARHTAVRPNFAGDVSIGASVSVRVADQLKRERLAQSLAQHATNPACEHDLNKPNTTVSAITRKKARCNVCAQVWESA